MYQTFIREWRSRKPVSVFESVIYLRNLPPGIERAALICRYIWSCRFRGRLREMSPFLLVGSCPTVSPLPFGGLFSVTAFVRLLPPALSAADRPTLSGLSSALLPRQIAPPVFLLTRRKFTKNIEVRARCVIFRPRGRPPVPGLCAGSRPRSYAGNHSDRSVCNCIH